MRRPIIHFRDALAERTPILVWTLVALGILLAPLLIAATGYLPVDDCIRHAAKAVDGRPWSDILVLRPGLMPDPNAAWHGMLRAIHLATGAGTEDLALLEMVGLCILVLAAPLPWLRAPEAWIGAWVLVFAAGGPVARLLIGRPLLVNMAGLLCIMALWSRRRSERHHGLAMGATVLVMALAALLHGSWYLLALVPASFLAAGRFRDGARLLACWLLGSAIAGLATGHPWAFLGGQLLHMEHALGGIGAPATLVPELRPSGGGGLVALACSGAVAFKLVRDPRPEALLEDPLVILALAGWVLGLKITRFWGDWGLPCAALWLALEAEGPLLRLGARAPLRRLELAAALCLAFLLITSADVGARWTGQGNSVYLTEDRPDLRPWLPGRGGILYSDGMDCFFETFFRNPGAPWKYMVGFEPSMMPPGDLAVFRQACQSKDSIQALEPWIDRMRPEDRLVLRVPWKQGPFLPRLEWFHVGGDLWIGKPRAHA